jgi:hypothetical protein
MSVSPKVSNSGVVFMGATHSGLPSLCTILEDSTDEFYMASSGEESSGLPVSQRCSMGKPPASISTTPWSEDALTPQAMTMVPSWTITPLPNTRLPPEQ